MTASYDIQVLPAQRTYVINPREWDELAAQSIYPNPFYERWNLTPALEHFGHKDIGIVKVRQNHSLIGLFPIELRKQHGAKFARLWFHKHCFLSNPLIRAKINFAQVAQAVNKHLHLAWLELPCHWLDDNLSSPTDCQPFQRAAIHTPQSVNQHQQQQDGKTRREQQRLRRKLESEFQVEYREHRDYAQGLKNYCALEAKGWKGKNNSAIFSDQAVSQYYQSLTTENGQDQALICQELWANQELIAAALRIKTTTISGIYYFDIKTTFNEEFRAYSPGMILELINMSRLEKDHFSLVDSCTQPDNKFINQLWPGQIRLGKSRFFNHSFVGHFWRRIFQLKHSVKKH